MSHAAVHTVIPDSLFIVSLLFSFSIFSYCWLLFCLQHNHKHLHHIVCLSFAYGFTVRIVYCLLAVLLADFYKQQLFVLLSYCIYYICFLFVSLCLRHVYNMILIWQKEQKQNAYPYEYDMQYETICELYEKYNL